MSSHRLDDGSDFSRHQVARYHEFIDDKIQQLPIESEEDYTIVNQALTILNRGEPNFLDPFEGINDDHTLDLKERIADLAEIIHHPEEMLHPQFSPADTNKLSQLFSNRILFQFQKLSETAEREQARTDREAVRQAASEFQGRVANLEPPSPGSEAHTTLLRQSSSPTYQSPLPVWLWILGTPQERERFNQMEGPFDLFAIPDEEPESFALQEAYYFLITHPDLNLTDLRRSFYLAHPETLGAFETVEEYTTWTFEDFDQLPDELMIYLSRSFEATFSFSIICNTPHLTPQDLASMTVDQYIEIFSA